MLASSTCAVMLQPTPQYGHSVSTCFSCAGGRICAASGLFTSASVGHASMHSPHDTQLELPIGRSRSNAIFVP